MKQSWSLGGRAHAELKADDPGNQSQKGNPPALPSGSLVPKVLCHTSGLSTPAIYRPLAPLMSVSQTMRFGASLHIFPQQPKGVSGILERIGNSCSP